MSRNRLPELLFALAAIALGGCAFVAIFNMLANR